MKHFLFIVFSLLIFSCSQDYTSNEVLDNEENVELRGGDPCSSVIVEKIDKGNCCDFEIRTPKKGYSVYDQHGGLIYEVDDDFHLYRMEMCGDDEEIELFIYFNGQRVCTKKLNCTRECHDFITVSEPEPVIINGEICCEYTLTNTHPDFLLLHDGQAIFENGKRGFIVRVCPGDFGIPLTFVDADGNYICDASRILGCDL